MFETTFYRFVPSTFEDLEELFNRNGIAFVIKEDTTEEIQKFVNWIGNLTPYEDHIATYIIITGEVLNKCYSEYWEYKKLFPDDIVFLGFYLDEMEDRDTVIGELGFEPGDHFWIQELLMGDIDYIDDAINERKRINDL